MASFDPEEAKQSESSDSGIVKYPMKRLDLSVRNFIKVLDIDLDRLYKHTENIKKLTNAEDWPGLHKEQVNASRTVQQINANIRGIERARTQVVDKDLSLFDSKIQDVKTKALTAMDEFMVLIGPGIPTAPSNVSSERRPAVETGHDWDGLELSNSHPVRPGLKTAASESIEDHIDSVDNVSSHFGNTSVSLTAFAPAPVTTKLHVAPQHTDASHSWEELQENVVELNELVHHFADQVEQQGEVINTIDDNIETAHANVKEGTANLVQASKYKSVLFPVAGAVIGGMVGGPIGFVAGMKLGGLAGFAGGAAGFFGGRMLKKRQQKIAETELENLSDKDSMSISETACDETDEKARTKPEQNRE